MLDSAAPQVLIMHTHATEDYRLSAGLWYSPGDGARTTDTNLNMCAVGRVMADTLNAAGLNTLHDETLNDYPSYTETAGGEVLIIKAAAGLAAEPPFRRRMGAEHGGDVPRFHPACAVQLPLL